MRRILAAVLGFVLLLGLAGCGGSAGGTAPAGASAPTWQEQYDLGIRYLSEGNYQEAIIAFTAAIEIDPKRPEAYIGLADVYTAQGDTDAAKKALEDGLAATEDDSIRARLDEWPAPEASQTSVEELTFSDFSYHYEPGGDWPGDEVGGLTVRYTVTGPANVAEARIGAWLDTMPDQPFILQTIQDMEALWQEEPDGFEPTSIPFTRGNTYGVFPGEPGTTVYALVMGLDADLHVVACTVVPMDIPG